MIPEQTPDFDELEDEPVSPRRQGLSRLMQWLIVLSLAIAFLPLYFASTVIKEDTVALNTQMTDIDSTLNAPRRQNANEKSLKSTLVQLQQQAGTLQVALPTLNANRVDWPTSMSIIGSYDQTRLVLIGIAQNNKVITLNGQAVDENAVMAYAQLLKDSSQFSRVVVEGITIMPSPTPAPTLTPADPSVVAATSLPKDYDDLSNKFAVFTIVLEAIQPPAATPTNP